VFVAAVVAHLFTNDLQSAVLVRAIMGIAAAPLSTLAFYYMLEWLPPARKMSIGICFGLLGSGMALPLARMISPDLLQLGGWHGLYLLEVGLALVALAVIYLLPLTHPPRSKVFDRDDWISFPLLFIGTGSLVIVLSMGRAYWWFETPWLGVLLAISIASLALLAVHELHRKNPMIDLHWLATRDMLNFAGVLMLFRLLLSEQSVGVTGLFTSLGIQNEQLIPLFRIIGVSTFLATAGLALIIKPQRTAAIHLLALGLIAAGSWLDSHSTVLSRPEQFYLSQAMIGAASALFLPPALLTGFGKAMAKGPQYILSFVTVFLSTQSLGGMIGSAVFSTFVTLREQFHSNMLLENVTLLNPQVALRIQQYGGAFSRVLTDETERNFRGLTMLGQAATQQAYVLAYNDMFLLVTGAAVLTAGLLLLQLGWSSLRRADVASLQQPN
ncbi:MAG: transporter, partial [Cypionkella sp.]|uniref:MFS transporter n=1 Tax=Cypionkella sp. TaxID=2811411 RepID=UPI0026195340